MLNFNFFGNSFFALLTARATLYCVMPLLFLVGIVLLIKPRLLSVRTKLSVSTVRTIAIILTVLCVLYFLFIIWMSFSFGRGPEARL